MGREAERERGEKGWRGRVVREGGEGWEKKRYSI